MSELYLVGADVIAVVILAFGLYYPRHRRADMVPALLGLNVGVLAVATVLSRAGVGAGLGLGLFGVLSILRLRSAELDQQEVAYYFAALCLGLVGGVSVDPDWLGPMLMLAILTALFIGDHRRLFARSRRKTITLDAAYPDEAALRSRLESLLGAKVRLMKVRRLDLVNDTTTVDVRYTVDPNQ